MIELRRITKRFPGVVALEGVSLSLQSGQIHALVGENGAGKTTLINILSGVLLPDDGQLLMDGVHVRLNDSRAARGVGIATVHQESDLFPDLSVAENVALEKDWPRRRGFIDWPALRRGTRESLRSLDVDLAVDQPAGSLTAGQRQLVGIAAALSSSARLLILDEPTSSLAEADTEALFAHLRRFRAQGGSVLYVSHRLEEVFALADVATVLRDGRSVWHGRLEATSSDQLIAWMVGREVTAPARGPAAAPGPERLTCKDVSADDGSFSRICLDVRAGETIGLYGLVGAGRSEWAESLFGLRNIREGQLFLDGKSYTPRSPGDAARRGLAFLPEDRLRLGLCAGLSVRANAVLAVLRRLAKGPFVTARRESRKAQTLIADLGVRLRSLEQRAGTLSGGNQQKVILGRWLACEPEVLILDEPTRGVDVGAKAEIHALLRRLAANGTALVLISSDLPEVLSNSDRIGVFRGGQLIALLDARATTAAEIGNLAIPTKTSSKPEGSERPSLQPRAPRWRQEGLRELSLFLTVMILALLIGWRTVTFWQAGTLRDIAETASLLAVCGLGAALVILAGAIDISFGSMMALAAATAGYLMQEGHTVIGSCAAGICAASAAGLLNAALTLLGRVHPIVVTLGMMSVYRGLTLALIGDRDVTDLPDSFTSVIRTVRWGLPPTAMIALVVVSLAWLWSGWTVMGRQARALGSNPTAAKRVGIHPARVWLVVFALQGLLAGLAGLLALGITGRVQGTDFEEKTLEAIGVAVVGGIAITGGRGTVWGVWGAALLFRVLEKGWILLHISSHWQRIIVGSLLLLAIVADRLLRREDAQAG
jgi:ABC-type sugar transport system ATPase subunit/ribose/xylose/arabinose/galactoside ABC-type transport system permease subunit